MDEYVQRKYSSMFAAVPFFSPALQHIFDGVQEQTLAIRDAFDLVIRSKYHCRSIDHWVYAHLIVRAALKAGHVPRSRNYNGDDIFWWKHLYKMASLIEMGKEDKPLVIKFIVEAEEAGTLGGGCAEMFKGTTAIRSEITMLSRQIESSKRCPLWTQFFHVSRLQAALLHID